MATIRNKSITSSSAGSYTIPWPSGSVAGDTAFLFVGGGWQVSTAPAGWTVLDASPGSNWNGSVYTKQLTSGDITTGSVSFTMGGSFDTVIAMVVYIGAVNYRAVAASRNGSGSSPIALNSQSTVQAGDDVLLFGSNRANSVDTIDKGTSIATISAGSASGVVTEYTPGSSGVFTANFSYATVGIGNYQIIVPIFNAGATTLQEGGVVRETLGSGTAQLRTSTVVREALTSGVVAAIQLQTGGVVRETLGSGTAQLKVSSVVRETLISSKSGRRRYVLVY